MTRRFARRTPIIADFGWTAVASVPADDTLIRRAARWYATAPDAHVQYLVDYTTTAKTQPVKSSLAVLGSFQAKADSPEMWERGLRATQDLRSHGYDTLVLAALRGSGLSQRRRLLAAASGLTPHEAITAVSDGTLTGNFGSVETLFALRSSVA